MDFVSNTDQERKQLLAEIGVNSVEDLLRDIPPTIRRDKPLDLPSGLSEPELVKYFRSLSEKNINIFGDDSYLGAGAYEHFIPGAIESLTSRGEFFTAYTPYQAEASQGTLQAIYEFQSLISELTGMDIVNASLYDGATATVEAIFLALRHTRRNKIVLSHALSPLYRRVIATYLKNSRIKIVEINLCAGVTELEKLEEAVDENTAAVVIQTPNFLGYLEDTSAVERIVHQRGSLFIVNGNPLALGILKPPGEFNADCWVGEGQPLGIPLSYGGPYLGLFACKKEFLREVPGRLVSRTKDILGQEAFTLTLQTREQHIRRGKATSNICTNQNLCALTAAIYLCLVGKQGIAEIARRNVINSHYAQKEITKIEGFSVLNNQPFFNEFVIQSRQSPDEINKKLIKKKIIGGLPLKKFYPEYPQAMLWCVTETKTKADIDRLLEVLSNIS